MSRCGACHPILDNESELAIAEHTTDYTDNKTVFLLRELQFKQAMTFKEYDVVRLIRDLPEQGLVAGQLGAVVMVYDNPPALEVEFCDDEGGTLALVTLREEDLKRADESADSG